MQQNLYLELECHKMPKLRTFVLFKDFSTEPNYLTKPLSYFQRRVVAKIRLGCLPLHIETGRYSIPRIPEENRICLVCKDLQGAGDAATGQAVHGYAAVPPIENELHFLFSCPKYSCERSLWLEKMILPTNFESFLMIHAM